MKYIKDLLNEQQYVNFIHPNVLDDNGKFVCWEHWLGLVDDDGNDNPFMRGLQYWTMYSLIVNHGANGLGYSAMSMKHFDWETFLDAVTNYMGDSEEFIDTVLSVLDIMNQVRPTIVLPGFLNNMNIWNTQYDDVSCMGLYATLRTGVKNYFDCVMLDYIKDKTVDPVLRLKQLEEFINKMSELMAHDSNYALIRKCLRSDLFNVATKLNIKRATAHGTNKTALG